MSSPLSVATGSFGRISLLRIDRPVAAHAHPHCHALFKVGGADSLFEVAGHRLPLTDGTAVLVNPWQVHGYPYDPRRGGSLVLALYIEPDWLGALDPRCGRRGGAVFAHPCARPPAGLRRLAMAMGDELAGGRPDGARAVAILEALMAGVVGAFGAFGAAAAGARRVGDHRIRRVLGLLRQDPTRQWTAAELADAAALSRAHFFERFRAETGLTPGLFCNALRMEAAYDGLWRGGATLGEISRSLGFAAQSHFSRFFAANHGVAPGAYLRAGRRLG